MKIIEINTKSKYDVIVGHCLLDNAFEYINKISKSKKIVIITDDIVSDLYKGILVENLENNGCEVYSFVFENGEKSKSHKTLLEIYDFLSNIQFSRGDLLIALGGGVVGDIVGFCAASYLRGVDFIQIPTTLLSQVDSSVGGKTAVNIDGGKNLVGAFYQPKLVLCDIDTLATLNKDTFSDGIAEMIKYGAIKSATLFDKLLNEDINNNLDELVEECIKIKRDVVVLDEFDKNERMLLNFGHTFGHAVEKYYNYQNITHGKGVAIGMVLVSEWSERLGLVEKGITKKIISCIKKHNLPYSTDIPKQILMDNALNDKKRSKNVISIVIVEKIGQSKTYPISIEDLQKTFVGGKL